MSAPPPPTTSRGEPWISIGVFAVAAAVLGWGIGSGSLYNGDDAIYALIAREMREGGDLIHLRLDGAILHQRPPLYPWLLVASTSIFGETMFALRLPAVLMGAGSSLLVYRLGRRSLPAPVALAGAALFSTLALTYVYARSITSDTTLTFFILLSIHLFLEARDRDRALWAAGAALGAALMTKQVVGFMALVAPAAVLVAGGRKALPPARRFLGYAGGVLAVAAPWHVVMLIVDGRAFVDGYLGYNVLARATTSVLYRTSPWFYLDMLWRKEGVIVLLALGGLALCGWRAARERDPRQAVVLAWLLGALLAFSLAGTRLDYYLLPAYPALALLVVAPLAAARKTWLVAAGCALLVAVSAWHNVRPRLGRVDHSGEIRFLARLARAQGQDGDPLYVVDDIHLAARFYSRRPTFLLVSRRPNYQRMLGTASFAEPGTLLHVPQEELARFLEGSPRYFVLVPKAELRHQPPPGIRIAGESPRYLLYTNVR